MEDPNAMDKNMKECLINKLKSQMDSVELYGMMILSFQTASSKKVNTMDLLD